MEIVAGFYVYCIIDSNILDSCYNNLKGIDGSDVFLLPLCSLGLIVSRADVQKGNKDINYIKNCVMAHEKISELLMDKYTVLPVKFHTVFKNEANAITSFQKYYSDFEDNVKRLKNTIEYGLKAIWHETEDVKTMALNIFRKSQPNNNSESKSYLENIYGKYKRRERLNDLAKVRSDEINKYFDSFIVDKKINILQTNKLFLNASYLIYKKDKDAFIQAFNKLKVEMNGKYDFLFTGPWPPYNFITIKR